MSQPIARTSPEGFDGLYGLELTELEEGRARARVAVRAQLKQPTGVVHGGVYAALSESLTTAATALALGPQWQVAALSSQTSFLRPIAEGTIHAAAAARHRGRTTWVWEIEISDDAGRLCVLARMTIGIRESGGT